MVVSLLGQVVNATALGSAGGNVYRAVALRQDGENWHRTLASLVADRVVGVIVLVTLTALGACWYMQHPILGALAQWTVGIWLGGVVMVLLGFWAAFHQWLGHWGRQRLGHQWETQWALLRNMSHVLHNRTVLAKVLWRSVIVQALHLGTMTCIGYAFGFDYALEASVLVMPLAALLSVMISMPQGLGVLEGMLVAILASAARSCPAWDEIPSRYSLRGSDEIKNCSTALYNATISAERRSLGGAIPYVTLLEKNPGTLHSCPYS